MSHIKKLLKKHILNPLGVTSEFYAQGKEDQVLQKLHSDVKHGFYIDIGSHHPIYLSNTFHFYSKGWKGICIDPNPNFKPLYEKVRPNDTFLNMAVSNFEGESDFFSGQYDVHSSLLKSKHNDLTLIKVPVKKLTDICIEHGVSTEFEFLSLDTEGTEIDVLKGFDLKKYKPKNILVEYNTAGKLNEEIEPYLVQFGYRLIMMNEWNMLFSKQMTIDLAKIYS